MGKLEHGNYVVQRISKVNELVDDLYEAMMDREAKDVRRLCAEMHKAIKEIEESQIEELSNHKELNIKQNARPN